MSVDTKFLVKSALEAISSAMRQAERYNADDHDLSRLAEIASSYLTYADFVRVDRALAALRKEA